jgi:hypothetical protein
METIGRYEILEEIGRGGFAVVYKARDPDLDRLVALKVLAPHLSWDPTFAERFHWEAQATARLEHPNIVIIYEVSQDGEDLYIAMKYLPGRTLAQILAEEGAMSLERGLPILEQVASALDYAHAEGVLHRDVKPSNMIVQEAEGGQVQVTLMDFGLVKAMESSQSITSMGTILGSPEYMAPEQADPDRADEIGYPTDRYAFGVVAYQMLTGRVPFPGSTPATLVAHMQKAPPEPQSLRQDLPDGVAEVLLKALSKRGEDRYGSAGELVAALRERGEAEEQDREREERSKRLYRQIRSAMEAEDWVTAEARCREILALEADYRDVPELWTQVRAARARQKELEQLYGAAQAWRESGSWAEVVDLCQQIEALEPGYRDVRELLAQAKHQARFVSLYEKAQAALQGQRWAEAVDLCQQIEALEPGYRDVGELLARAERQARLVSLYSQAQAALRQERWEEVRQLCVEIEGLEPGYRSTASLRASAEAALAGQAPTEEPGEEEPAPPPVPAVPKKRRKIPVYVWVAGGITLVVLIVAGLVVAQAIADKRQRDYWATRSALNRTATAEAQATEARHTAVALSTATAEAQVMAAWAAQATDSRGSRDTATAEAQATGTKAALHTAWAEIEATYSAADDAALARIAEDEAAAATVTRVFEDGGTRVAEAAAATATRVAEAAEAPARARPTAPAGWTVTIWETFDSNTLLWREGERSSQFLTGSQSFVDGVYHWEFAADKSMLTWSLPQVQLPSTDFHLTVEVRQTSGDASAWCGIVFRKTDDDNFYSFRISDGGWKVVAAQVNGEWVYPIFYSLAPAIRPGDTNVLTVVGQGSHFDFFINDELVGEIEDASHAEGEVGLALNLSEGTSAAFEFDNFELYTP